MLCREIIAVVLGGKLSHFAIDCLWTALDVARACLRLQAAVGLASRLYHSLLSDSEHTIRWLMLMVRPTQVDI
jgi:hypothetical protein